MPCPGRKCPVSRTNSGFSRGLPSCPGLSRVSQLRCPRTVVETFRSFLIHVFWPPEGWAGETLPVHQQLVHATLTALWSLPFWKVFWWLCGFPMLPLMAAVLIVPELKFPTFLRRKRGSYVKPTDRYRNAPATGRFVAPRPSFRQKLNAKRRLLKLKNRPFIK